MPDVPLNYVVKLFPVTIKTNEISYTIFPPHDLLYQAHSATQQFGAKLPAGFSDRTNRHSSLEGRMETFPAHWSNADKLKMALAGLFYCVDTGEPYTCIRQ